MQLHFVIFSLIIMITGRYAQATCGGANCTCTVSNSSAVAFGTYNPLSGSSLSGTGSVSVTCTITSGTLNVSYVIALSAGLNGTFSARKMKFSSSLLPYNLYTTAAFTSIWGDGTSGTSTVPVSYSLHQLSNTVASTVFGLIPASQNVPAGSYTDTITVTVTF